MLRNTRNPAFAARILFLCAMTPARAYTPAQASFLCGLPLPEAEQALLDLERNGLAVRCKGGRGASRRRRTQAAWRKSQRERTAPKAR